MYLEGISIFLLPHPPRPLDIETKFCVLTKRTCVACIQQQEIQIFIHSSTYWRTKKKLMKMWEKRERGQMLTLGCLWFRTMANSRPSGEKAGTNAPLDFTGWQGGVRREIGYVLVAHCMLYPTELQRQMCTFNNSNTCWDSSVLHRPVHSPHSHMALFPLNFQTGDD